MSAPTIASAPDSGRSPRLYNRDATAAVTSHPGSDVHAMIDVALFLKRNGYRPDQVQDFIPSPFDLAAAMYHTGLDPLTLKPVAVAKNLRDRKVQRALLQFFKPAFHFEPLYFASGGAR